MKIMPISSTAITMCPIHSPEAAHYNENGTCKCEKPVDETVVVWSHHNPYGLSVDRGDLWDKIDKASGGRSYSVEKIDRAVKPGTKSKQYRAVVRVFGRKFREV